MIIKIEDLDKSKDGILSFDFEDIPDGIDFAQPAHAKLEIKRLGAGFISVTGSIKAKINAVCDNCLKNLSMKLKQKLMKPMQKKLYMKSTKLKQR